MWCAFCGRADHESPKGIWRGPTRAGREGICVYCARTALRELDPSERAPVLVLPVPRGEGAA